MVQTPRAGAIVDLSNASRHHVVRCLVLQSQSCVCFSDHGVCTVILRYLIPTRHVFPQLNLLFHVQASFDIHVTIRLPWTGERRVAYNTVLQYACAN